MIMNVAFVKHGKRSYAITGSRTFRLVHQPPHPYLDWARRHFANLQFEKYYKAFPEAKILTHCTLYEARIDFLQTCLTK
jgi:hypothetical protein